MDNIENVINSQNTFFVDGIGEIRFLNGVVRISYGSFYTKTLSNNQMEQNVQPQFKNELKLIMPVTSFMGILKAQTQLYEKLKSSGMLPLEQSQILDANTEKH